MKLKFDDKGAPVLAEVNGERLPVYVHPDGKEAPLDAASLMSSLNSRAEQNRRIEAEMKELRDKLKSFSGIEDAEFARKAIDTYRKLDQKQLIDAGEVDKVKSEISKVYESQIGELRAEKESLSEMIWEMKIGGAFSSSKFIKDKVAIPPDMLRARFGANFGVEGNELYAVDGAGNKIYSRTKPGQLASFDEAIEMLIDGYEYKDSILKGSGSSGSGSSAGGGHGAGGNRTMTRSQFDGLDAFARAKAAREGVQLVDG